MLSLNPCDFVIDDKLFNTESFSYMVLTKAKTPNYIKTLRRIGLECALSIRFLAMLRVAFTGIENRVIQPQGIGLMSLRTETLRIVFRNTKQTKKWKQIIYQ